MGRPLRGSRLASFYTSETEADRIVPPSLATLDSAFQLQEYIAAIVRLSPHDIERIVKVPGRNANGSADEKEREVDGEDERVSVDEACWIYEQLRRLAQDLTHPLITMLQQECTRQTCPEMKAGEWLYLCVAHGNSGAMEHCCAIDYIVHTLDSATALLNSPRAFPSRISIPQTSHRHFPSLARRLGRIFAHAYHHHRLAFESAEAESALYARFLALSRHFDLVPAEFLVIPERNDQGEEDMGRGNGDGHRKNMTLLTRDHVDPISVPLTTIPTNSPSPRIGGRARTDTMYLSGGYSSPHRRGSPGVSPAPDPQWFQSTTPVALAVDVRRDQETLIVKEGVAVPQEGIAGVVAQEATDQAGEQAPEVKESAASLRMPGQVFARDFALEAPLPVAVREPTGDGADATADATDAPIEDVPYEVNTVDAETEQDDTSSYPEASGDAPDMTSSKPNEILMIPSDYSDSIPAPPYSELPVAEPLLPVLASHSAEAQAELELPVEDENAVIPEPDAAVAPEESAQSDGDDTGAGAQDEGERDDEVKEEEVMAETETSSSVTDAQQETGEASVEENTENPLQSEDA